MTARVGHRPRKSPVAVQDLPVASLAAHGQRSCWVRPARRMSFRAWMTNSPDRSAALMIAYSQLAIKNAASLNA